MDTETIPGKKPVQTMAEESPSVEIFSTSSGIRTVGSQVRVRILTVLSSRELSFDEIVRVSGKAKSTVSVHLKGLEKEGIIGSKKDPGDSRKKIFFIRSPCIGNLSRGLAVDEDEGQDESLDAWKDPSGFYRYMFRTIRVSLLSEGINIDPVLNNAGYRVGRQLYPEIADPDINTVLEKLREFWTEHHLGNISIESLSPISIKVTDCFECGDLPQLGRPACAFDGGILRAVFSLHFGEDLSVEETACYAMGNDFCRFLITPKQD